MSRTRIADSRPSPTPPSSLESTIRCSRCTAFTSTAARRCPQKYDAASKPCANPARAAEGGSSTGSIRPRGWGWRTLPMGYTSRGIRRCLPPRRLPGGRDRRSRGRALPRRRRSRGRTPLPEEGGRPRRPPPIRATRRRRRIPPPRRRTKKRGMPFPPTPPVANQGRGRRPRTRKRRLPLRAARRTSPLSRLPTRPPRPAAAEAEAVSRPLRTGGRKRGPPVP
mmetsp:Transcript_9206/g.27713  ORF Transcript_9206/g.27713 Transcript_9206/m.27713 type:complete len:223 (+) Transcript_9206:712-1380(+)